MHSRFIKLLPNVINHIRPVHLFQAAILCLTGLLCLPLSARVLEPIQPHGALVDSVTQFVKQQFSSGFQVYTQVGKIDPHLRLSACTKPPEAFYPVGARKMGITNIGIRCLGEKTWTIYLPVHIKVYGDAVVSKHSLPRGSVLQASDLGMAKQELSRAMNGYYTDIEQLVGMSLKRNLAQGTILQPSIVNQRHMVKRGDLITILAETNGLAIRVKGKAMMDGFRGQSIRVRNFRSKRELQGEVIAPGTVKINL
ncbi:MAG: flagellar basal body P-ring formation chaperone FlgA [Gammaproteobacteria bacterium]|nr:flagellar basal body P-ring formation chaperone FlgA [Gammaproteobacteria bacterium]MDH5652968.1 flagellar basal body P-ring formation chaperone FlgA [Gammaproteobacteria bacterium]